MSHAQTVLSDKAVKTPIIAEYSSSRDSLPNAPEPQATPTPSDTQNASAVKAVIGLGFHVTGIHPDYSLSSNVISSTHAGNVTPQYMLGVAYELPFNYAKDHSIGQSDTCHDDTTFRCRPMSGFVSAKFSPTSSDTVNGVTFGIAHKIVSSASLLIAASLDATEEPSPGFIQAAVQTVNAQQAASNPYYALFKASDMSNNKRDAFDGFSTLFITSTTDMKTGAVTFTQGNPIFQGNPLITNYHFGFLFGVALTPDFKGLLGIKQ